MVEASKHTPTAEEQVDDFDHRLTHLKFLYEQYFLGLERKAPEIIRKEVEGTMRQLLTVQTKNTATRFRITNLKAKLVTYQTHWDRCMQQMEEGSFHRDRFRLKLYDRKTQEKEPATAAGATSKNQEKSESSSKRNSNIEALLSQYVDAKKKCNEKVDGLNYEAFAKTLTSQTQTLKQRFQCKSVRFKVVIENGKTKLKATPT